MPDGGRTVMIKPSHFCLVQKLVNEDAETLLDGVLLITLVAFYVLNIF